jgi:UDP-3-O-[3-hydroxymyristoyl] glucosamine N-acyltransferase
MIHASATICSNAKIADSVSIGPYCFIGNGVSIGRGSKLIAFVNIEAGAVIGENCVIYPHVSIYDNCVIHNNVHIYPHSVIGSNGFGYATDATGSHHFIPQIGTAILKDNVHFGPQSFIDRAALDKSQIGENSHIGSFSHIAHNSSVGKNSRAYNDLIIAGSTTVGDNFTSEGATAITGHINVADNVHVKAVSAFNNSESSGGTYRGFPHQAIESFNERLENIKLLPKLRQQILRLKGLSK